MCKNIWQTIKIPLIFLGALLLLYLIWKILDLPPKAELIQITREYYDKYGLITIFVSAIIEGLLLIGWYYPGSLVIFLGVIFANKDIPQIAEVILVATMGLFIAYIIDFFLGKYGWYRLFLAFGLKESLNSAQHRLTKYGLTGIFISYWQPNLAALTSTAAGILYFPFRKFLLYSLISVITWNIFWSAVVYFFGEASLSFIGLRFVFIVIVGWIALRLLSRKFKRRDN